MGDDLVLGEGDLWEPGKKYLKQWTSGKRIVFGEPGQGWVLTDELEKVTSGLQGVGEGVQSGSVNQGRPDKQGGSGYRGPQP
jgi:hypothetical protein